ncbi:unknown protein [Microcystis aeruginosa NIES-843]|uniref:Uncharacterized protein n=1 Tax=Microcystis aeruginosa (strain NIES-843 / IAM M-2473) TaxID=449447 RepID=B0JLE5_MICAN|nr:unknown protein [Microcystis aeruginosa NIES-843]
MVKILSSPQRPDHGCFGLNSAGNRISGNNRSLWQFRPLFPPDSGFIGGFSGFCFGN